MEPADGVRYVNRLHDLGPRVGAALARGHVIVLWVRTEPSVLAARDASRRASAWIESIATVGRGGLSRSATSGMAAVAAHGCACVGVDIEATSTLGALGDSPLEWLHPDEQALPEGQEAWSAAEAAAALWVRKEAALKAFGVGLAVAPSAIAVGAYNETWQTVTHRTLGTAAIQSLPAPAGYAVAVALRGVQQAPITFLEIAARSVTRGQGPWQ